MLISLVSTGCPGCGYRSSCCCAPYDALFPATLVYTKYTKTVSRSVKGAISITRYTTRIKTKTIAGRQARKIVQLAVLSPEKRSLVERSENVAPEAVEAEQEPDEVAIADPFSRSLESRAERHLCPRCPATAQIGKNYGGHVMWCCPPRRTIRIWVKKVRTRTLASSKVIVRKTRTATMTVS